MSDNEKFLSILAALMATILVIAVLVYHDSLQNRQQRDQLSQRCLEIQKLAIERGGSYTGLCHIR